MIESLSKILAFGPDIAITITQNSGTLDFGGPEALGRFSFSSI
jgi:hypothetical protein